MTNKAVEVVAYDTKWIEIFEAEAEHIQQILRDNCIAIHHIGSTSIPGLAAKPIIDMIPVVRNIVAVDNATIAMERIGYIAKGEHGMLFRRFFQKDGFNIHVFEAGNPVIARHLQFRDWLRAHHKDRDAYAALKKELAEKYSDDLLSYCFAKETFIASIDKKTGFKGLHIVKALTPKEWEVVAYLREQCTSNQSLPAINANTTDNSKYLHFILYQGFQIIGYANIELNTESQATILLLVIDTPYRNQSNGEAFLKQCEHWLKQQNIKTVQVQALAESEYFYQTYGYVPITEKLRLEKIL
ncbi:GNAT family N-acetyltransferase [Candidatus Berkiella cookevillensis]|uniref:Dephospho-CoA kinase/protein folding accessory domain-containing protein n=1 Tax=Candidatus Berkiella cookevillensis TaxID=437022 RepID=A0A0Q9YBU0_9GAMM|nr:GNAT family N-acetyltransferase [Candidatus Berkiella cookevillensis]MCS5707354.1 GNAT family N-acetyltransferase [Candidatus Berkiella cookevillensis]